MQAALQAQLLLPADPLAEDLGAPVGLVEQLQWEAAGADGPMLDIVLDGPALRALLDRDRWADKDTKPQKQPKRPKLWSPRFRLREGTAEEIQLSQDSQEEECMPVLRLPEHILFKVFERLDRLRDLCCAGMVCRTWYSASTHRQFWRRLAFDPSRSIAAEQVVSLCRKHRGVKHLNLRGVANADDVLTQIDGGDELHALCSLHLAFQPLSEAMLGRVSRLCPMLLHLHITDPVVPTGHAAELNFHLPVLEELEVISARAARVTVNCPMLQRLVMRRLITTPLSLICPQLTHLDLVACKLSDASLRQCAVSAPLLTRLSLAGCHQLTDETLRQVAASCSRLTTLNVSHCPLLTIPENFEPRNLKQLWMVGCKDVRDATLVMLNRIGTLERLVLDHCNRLEVAHFTLPHLHTLSLRSCRRLKELSVDTASLTSIDPNECQALTTVKLHAACLPTLQLDHLLALHTVSLVRCPALQLFSVTDCDQLSDDIFAQLSDAARCPSLNAVRLDQCEGLVQATLAAPHLQSLTLSGCKRVTRLLLDCPQLTALDVTGCGERLETARLWPVGLDAELDLGICPHLTTLELHAPSLQALQLTGCGSLHTVQLACPTLDLLDATFCSRMRGECVASIPSGCPALRHVALAGCSDAATALIPALRQLPSLTSLDVSHAPLPELRAMLTALCASGCPLAALSLQQCSSVPRVAIDPLLQAGALPTLRSLDVSWCNVTAQQLQAILPSRPQLTALNVSMCAHATAELFAPPPAAEVTTVPWLREVLCVGCPALRAVHLSTHNRTFAALRQLNLRMAAVETVAIQLPLLTLLDLSECVCLTSLQLSCPALTSLLAMGCPRLPDHQVLSATQGTPALTHLDARRGETPVAADAVAAIRVACPSLRCVLTNLEPSP